MEEKKGVIGSLLPVYEKDTTSSVIETRIKYKTENCKNLSLIITSIGKCENINFIDTIQLNTTKDWKKSIQTINTKETYLLNISIEAKSLNQNNAKIWISDFEVFINGKEVIDNSTQIDKKENVNLRINDLVHWNNINYNNLPFWGQKILALGETVHGTKTMNDIAFAIFKERILKHQCKFILLEIPLEYSFYINRFVKNDVNFKLADISAYFDGYLYSDSLLSFMQWLKEYNSTCNEKISVWGFDVNHVQLKSRIDLFNFFYNLNMNKHIKELDVICKLLIDTKVSFDKIIFMFDENPNLASVLNEEELKLMLHCLKITQQDSSTYYRFINRDNVMNEIMSFIIDNFLKKNETATLFGHFGHLNYLNGQDLSVMDSFSLGYYMKNKYKDDYSFIALTTYQGSAMLAKSNSEFGISILSSAPVGSLEYILNTLNTDSIYLSMSKIDCSDVLKLRFVGNKNLTDQFRYIIPKSRMDGVLFIKRSTSIDKRKTVLNRNLSTDFIIMNSYKEALEKISNK
ncbi:MAG: erythromycin esterase family protein [Paludibacter sp.]|nr:erythromycin esterase family protein [Paludibacter sp.]MDD4198392.1 erythromycin esterase family protein [Paludibacter sp.]MDD4427070.1 erythromycin esterase family protein [Paludibacter sp.]